MQQDVLLEDVFKTSGIPTYTFVKPVEWDGLTVALRTKGRGVVIEGPSGIGKTTCVTKVIEELNLNLKVLKLTARKKEDLEMISELPAMKDVGTVIIDDFHLLDNVLKNSIADYLKILADEEVDNSKLILVGINKAGDSLVNLAPDLNNRIDTIRFEANPEYKIAELIEKGETELRVQLSSKLEIIRNSRGSFHIAQLLCNKTCVLSGILKKQVNTFQVTLSFASVNERVVDELSRVFHNRTKTFAVGTKLRREGRAPYLHLLYWLAETDNWTIQIDEVLLSHPNFKGSVGQIIDKTYLQKLIEANEDIKAVVHYDSKSRILSVNDPKYYYYLKNIIWSKFAKEIGFLQVDFKSKYDFALSFAGEERYIADKLNSFLLENEIEVFYDKNEQHRILTHDVEEYLAPIYRSEASFVIVLLSKNYPKKIWTKFESEQFKHRFGENSVIPIWFSNVDYNSFDISKKVGGMTWEISGDPDEQIIEFGNMFIKLLSDRRIEEARIA
jgi:hypothetical protein